MDSDPPGPQQLGYLNIAPAEVSAGGGAQQTWFEDFPTTMHKFNQMLAGQPIQGAWVLGCTTYPASGHRKRRARPTTTPHTLFCLVPALSLLTCSSARLPSLPGMLFPFRHAPVFASSLLPQTECAVSVISRTHKSLPRFETGGYVAELLHDGSTCLSFLQIFPLL